MFHDPVVVPLSVSVEPVLSSVPVKLTVPPLRDHVPSPEVVNEPPRFNVPAVTLIVPVFLQLPETLTVAPETLIVPVFVHPPTLGVRLHVPVDAVRVP
jgi:hypothetical protein